MSNVQQPEVRRGGRNPAVADSAKAQAERRPVPGAEEPKKDTRPADQRSPYEPGADEQEPTPDTPEPPD